MNEMGSPVAIIIFIATIGVTLYTWYKDQRLYYKWMLNPYNFVHEKQYHTVLTSGLLHADFMHLIFNMITFYFFAFKLETILGSFGFLILYLGSMILSDISTIVKHKDNPGYNSVGASGAISGVLFSYILFSPYSKLILFPIPIPIPAVLFAVLYLVYSQYAAKKGADGINHEAHFWGALAGVIITIIIEPRSISIFLNSIM